MAAGAAQLVPATVALPARARCEIGRTNFSRRETRLSMAATDDVRIRFDHVSIAVKSIDRAYDFFAKYFPIQLRGAKSLDEQVSGSFYWQDFHLGGFVVELIEDPPGKPGFVTKFIERHGEGMHHLSIETDHLDAMVANLKAGGVRVVDEQK